ncbi:MAG TPA: hypothetical protein VHR66_15615 [Gemmataceae bacterium]|nr:hypothetical protein [Gemmataceae bacterium]
MRYTLTVVLAAFGLSLLPVQVRADVPPPVPAPKDVKFTIEVDEKAKGPKLILPVGMTRAQFRPRPVPKANPAKEKEPVAMLEIEGDDEVAPAPRNPNHLMIAGIGMTLALGFGGVWLVRRPGRGGSRGLVLLLVAGVTLAATTVVWANAPAPPPPPKKDKIVLPVAFEGNVNLEVVVAGDSIRLILDKETLEKIKKDHK